jgi:hypothetical protein
LLTKGALASYANKTNLIDSWEVPHCQMVNYAEENVTECLARLYNSAKRLNYFLFAGDSRVRDFVFHFATINGFKFFDESKSSPNRTFYNVDRNILIKYIMLHQLSTFNSSQIEYKDKQRNCTYLPSVIIVSVGPWYFDDYYELRDRLLKNDLTNFAEDFATSNQLLNSMILYRLQLPTTNYVPMWNKGGRPKGTYSINLRKCNSIAEEVLKPYSDRIRVWSSGALFVDNLLINNLDVNNLHRDSLHLSTHGVAHQFEANVLLNFHCNRASKKSSIHDLCCRL